MINCTDAVRQLWEFLDGSVPEADRDAIEEHLDVCKRCCGEAEFATELRDFLATNAYEALPENTKDRLTTFLDRL